MYIFLVSMNNRFDLRDFVPLYADKWYLIVNLLCRHCWLTSFKVVRTVPSKSTARQDHNITSICLGSFFIFFIRSFVFCYFAKWRILFAWCHSRFYLSTHFVVRIVATKLTHSVLSWALRDRLYATGLSSKKSVTIHVHIHPEVFI